MHGIYYITIPAFALFLILASTAALYMGIFKAHRPTVSFTKRVLSGIASGLIASLVCGTMYSYHYLGW